MRLTKSGRKSPNHDGLSGYGGHNMGEFTYTIEQVEQDGIFNFGTLHLNTGNEEYEIPLPVKTIPTKHSSANNDIYPEYKLINEVFHTIDSVDLRNAIYEDEASFIDDIKRKQKYSDPGQLDLVLLHYNETKPMTTLEAQEYILAIEEVSDIITSPLQFRLLHSLVEREPVDAIDEPFEYYKITKENFLQEASALDSAKPTMGSLSFFQSGQLNRLVKLYEDFNVEMIGVDFNRENPTSAIDEDLGDFIGSLSAFDLYHGSLMFAYNMERHQYRKSSKIYRAENLAPVGMGFDILGGNHLSLRYEPEGERSTFKIFDPDIAGYRSIGVDNIVADWPVTVESSILPEDIADFQTETAADLIKLVNAGEIQNTLFTLQTRLDNGHLSNFLTNKKGMDAGMTEAFQSALKAYQSGIDPSPESYG
jgi:hypothetical protein